MSSLFPSKFFFKGTVGLFLSFPITGYSKRTLFFFSLNGLSYSPIRGLEAATTRVVVPCMLGVLGVRGVTSYIFPWEATIVSV